MQPSLQPKTAGSGVASLDLSRIAQDLQVRKLQVESVVELLDGGNTVPFITRYRKERTGGLDEEAIRSIQARVQSQRQLADRKQTILKSIEGQGKLTEELRNAILAADVPKRLEDLYLPYKPKKRTLATAARERGLEPLAAAIWTHAPETANLLEAAATLVSPEKELHKPEDVLLGVQHILAEIIAENADIRGGVRNVLWESGKISTGKSEHLAENQGREYKSYFQFTEAIRHIPPHRILAINRGEKENALVIKLEFDQEVVKRVALEKLPLVDHPHAEFLKAVTADALSRLLLPSLEREIRRELTSRAEVHAVKVFARNLRSLLLAPPLRSQRVLAIDPGFRTGCKVAVLDETGILLQDAVIHPHAPQNRKADAKAKLRELICRHQTPVIAIGNGTASRETEELISELIADLEQRGGETPAPSLPEAPVIVGADSAVLGTPCAASATAAPVLAALPGAPSPLPAAPPEVLSTQYTLPSTEPSTPSAPPPDTIPAPVTPPDVLGTQCFTPGTELPAPAAIPDTQIPLFSTTYTEPATVFPTLAAPSVETATPAQAIQPRAPISLPMPPPDLAYVIVNEAGASVYSTSPVGREEFPSFDATTRGTISIGRRLQDPLSELVKIDPQNIGVGLYQHDVSPRQLKESLETIIESCVNQVGVDLNTASAPLLRHVSGLNQHVAREVVEYRKQHGPFRNREQLVEIPGVGPARYVQAAGFLKILGGDNPLDTTWIHPESYPAARQILAELGYGTESLIDRQLRKELRERLKTVSAEEVGTRLQVGVPTVKDILEALARPGRDPRDDLPPPIFKKGILRLEDLKQWMELKGTVLNVVDFGAFIDIGIKDTGLVHISQMANRYVKSPYDVAAVGDVVTVWVLSVDPQEHKVSLTMIRPGTERKPLERGAPSPGQRREHRGRPPRGRRPPPRGEHRGPPHQQQQPGSEGAVPGSAPATSGEGSGGPPRGRRTPPPSPPPRPRKPGRPAPKPKLSQAQLKGAADLRTFGELAAFLEAKQKRDEPPAPAGTPTISPPAEQIPPPPPA